LALKESLTMSKTLHCIITWAKDGEIYSEKKPCITWNRIETSDILFKTSLPLYIKNPLECGYYCALVTVEPNYFSIGLFDENGKEYPISYVEPLTEKQKKYITSICDGSRLFDIEDFIKQYRPDVDMKTLQWFDIYRLIVRAAETHKAKEPDDLMRLREIQDKITCLNIGAIKQWIYKGELTGYKKGKMWYVSKKEALIKLPRK
jgi:hypothetical protein